MYWHDRLHRQNSGCNRQNDQRTSSRECCVDHGSNKATEDYGGEGGVDNELSASWVSKFAAVDRLPVLRESVRRRVVFRE